MISKEELDESADSIDPDDDFADDGSVEIVPDGEEKPFRSDRKCRRCGIDVNHSRLSTWDDLFDRVKRRERDRIIRWTQKETGVDASLGKTTICADCWEDEPFHILLIDAFLVAKKDILFWFKHILPRKLTAPYWFVRYRTWDKYHVVKTGTPPGYQDAPERMLGVAFQLLVEFVELEKPFEGHVYWGEPTGDENKGFITLTHVAECGAQQEDPDKVLRDRKAEILDLYRWWTVDSVSEALDASQYMEYERKCQVQFERLAKLRPYLWT